MLRAGLSLSPGEVSPVLQGIEDQDLLVDSVRRSKACEAMAGGTIAAIGDRAIREWSQSGGHRTEKEKDLETLISKAAPGASISRA